MRPRTAALPTVGVSSNALAGARRFFAASNRCMFGCPIWGIETRRMTGHLADGEYGIWGQTHCFRRHADPVPGTLFAHRNKAAASCRTPNASRPPPPTASAAARGKPLGSAARSNEATWGQTRSCPTSQRSGSPFYGIGTDLKIGRPVDAAKATGKRMIACKSCPVVSCWSWRQVLTRTIA